jgi:outer membrane protein assembly factor BamB
MIKIKEKCLVVTLIILLLMTVTACQNKKESLDVSANDDNTASLEKNNNLDSSKDSVMNNDNESEGEVETNSENAGKDTIDMEDMSWSFKTNGGIASSPIIVDNTIFFGSKDGNLYAIDLDTKLEIWHYNSNGPILCQPAIFNNSIFFSSNEVYFSLDINSGKELWKYDTKADAAQKERKDRWDYHDSSPVVDNNVVYFGSALGRVFGFDVSTGEVVWEFATIDASIVRHTPLINDGILYVGDWNGKYYAVDIKTNKAIWTQTFSGSFHSSSTIFEDTLYFGGRDSRFNAVEIATGNIKWSYPPGSWASGDPIVAEGILYFPTSDSKLVYATNIENGSTIKKYQIYKNSFARSVIVDNILYITSGDAYEEPGTGKVQAFELDGDGKSIWEVNVDTGAVYTTPVIQNGMIYFGSEDGSLYAKPIN